VKKDEPVVFDDRIVRDFGLVLLWNCVYIRVMFCQEFMDGSRVSVLG